MGNNKAVTREEALAQIQILIDKYEKVSKKLHSFNEAQTRLLLIDRILNILNWPVDSFNPEKRATNFGFLDYLLTVDGVPFLVVEAKRVGDTFGHPSHRIQREQYRLSYLRTQFGKSVTEVIEQAEKYALSEGVSYALITNGAEWILAQARLPPAFKSTDELNAVYFGNIFSEGFHFDLFWELLNCQSVTEGILEDHFGILNCQEAEHILYPRAEFGTLEWQKPTNGKYLRLFYQYFFTDLVDPRRRKMLERCYVSDSRLDQYHGELQRALQDTSPIYIPDAIELSPGDHAEILASDSGDRKGSVVIVTGSVGCGKSTFIARVLQDAEQEIQRLNLNRQYVSINLIDEVFYEENVVRVLWELIYDEWVKIEPTSLEYDNLKKIFQSTLSSIRKGGKRRLFDADENEWIKTEAAKLDYLQHTPEKFLPACWEYYQKKKRTGIALIFDNVDRASEHFQRQVYGLAHKIARETGITVVITMRESTFLRGLDGGFLDVRPNDRVFHLQYPTLEKVLSRRVKYIESLFDRESHYFEDDPRISSWKRNLDWTSFSSVITEYVSQLKETFLIDSSVGRKILGLLASVAWHDVRTFLDTLRKIHIQLGITGTKWTFYDSLAVLMMPSELGDISPVVPNIFTVSSFHNFNCYFLKARILLFLIYGVKPHQVQQGITLEKILSFTRLYGYRQRWSEDAIEELVQSRLVECLEIPAEDDFTNNYSLEASHTFRRSALGLILIEEIICEPIYLSLIGPNLPFHKPHSFERFVRVFGNFIKTLDEGKLQIEAVELLLDDQSAAKIVARYLLDAFDSEVPSPNIKLYSSEISMTEQRLEEIISKLKEIGEVNAIPESQPLIQDTRYPVQQSFLDSLEMESESSTKRELLQNMPKPKNLDTARVGKSTLGPYIFWVLVALREKLGEEFVSGSRIASIINTFLVDETNQKEATNVSRTLRGPTLRSTEWLIYEPGPLYGVVRDWEPFWEEIFDEPAPDC